MIGCFAGYLLRVTTTTNTVKQNYRETKKKHTIYTLSLLDRTRNHNHTVAVYTEDDHRLWLKHCVIDSNSGYCVA